MTPANDALGRAIKISGTQSALAKSCGIKQAHIWNWINRDGGLVPPTMALIVAKATDHQITPHELRPDIYPNPDDGLPSSLRGVDLTPPEKGAA